MLITSPRHRDGDVDRWADDERVDAIVARSRKHSSAVARSIDALLAFVAGGPCYAGVSWGKDSVVIAHLVATHAPHVPLVYVRVEPAANPDCDLVRDAFLSTCPRIAYDEIVVQMERDDRGAWLGTGRLEAGFDIARERHGERYISGVRANESRTRRMRCATHGLITKRTCAPLGWWRGEDIFAYLHAHGLPVHPAYACSQGGAWARDRIRVASLGGERGSGMGRAEWEDLYYPEAREFRHA